MTQFDDNNQVCTNEMVEGINTDSRQQYDWKTKYPQEACKKMLLEAVYIATIFFVALFGLSMIFLGCFSIEKINLMIQFDNILCYFFSGLLGGIIFGIKYFYRAVARGYWSRDRIYWRLFSPWVSAVIAIIVGCMVEAGFINSSNTASTYTIVCLGFFSGYFADEAVGKMSEVANALFGNSSKIK